MCRDKVIQARLLRAKARFAANLRAAAHQGIQLQYLMSSELPFLDNFGPHWPDLQAILILDPNHREARELLPLPGGKMPTRIDHVSSTSARTPILQQALKAAQGRMSGSPRFSNEIWCEIASFLSRRDLRSLLFVPHALSSVASRLLFRDVCLQLGTAQFDTGYSEGAAEIDKWHAQRSADILIRLLSDTEYAVLVRSLSVRAPEEGQSMTSFQTGAPVVMPP